MPQFDQGILLTEIFWISISFFFYFLFIEIYSKKLILLNFNYKKKWLIFFLSSSINLNNKLKFVFKSVINSFLCNINNFKGVKNNEFILYNLNEKKHILKNKLKFYIYITSLTFF